MKRFKQFFIEAIDITKNENFKKWFRNSKVVDKQGKPLVVYHGTSSGFIDSFSIGHEGGIFFADNYGVSNGYSGVDDMDSDIEDDEYYRSPTTYQVFLSIQNPYYSSAKEVMPKGYFEYQVMIDVIKKAKNEGFDGMVIPSVNDIGGKSTQYVAFTPTQIKSATGNNGNFDPNNPDITK